MRRILLMGLLVAGCGRDEDFDGFEQKSDCDDTDSLIYPGAPDTPGDGVDSDCVGGDPELSYLGGWSIVDLTASYSAIQLFVAGTSSGEISVGEDMSASVALGGTLNPDIVGVSYDITLVMQGWISPVDGPSQFVLYAEGVNYDEAMHLDWDCAEDADGLACSGELKALDASLNAEAILARP